MVCYHTALIIPLVYKERTKKVNCARQTNYFLRGLVTLTEFAAGWCDEFGLTNSSNYAQLGEKTTSKDPVVSHVPQEWRPNNSRLTYVPLRRGIDVGVYQAPQG